MDKFLEQLPFLTAEHRSLSEGLADFIEQEIDPNADEEAVAGAAIRSYVASMGSAGILEYAVASAGRKPEVRSLCLIREALSYSSALADLAFVMQGLGTYAISQA